MARIAMIVGVTAGLYWPFLLSAEQTGAVICAGLSCLAVFFLWPNRCSLIALLLGAGFILSQSAAGNAKSHQLPALLEGPDLQLTGQVVSLPASTELGQRFIFQVDCIYHPAPVCEPAYDRLRLNWREPPIEIQAGQQLLLTARLKRPHGFANEAGFDYEKWLLEQNIHATGYVREGQLQQHGHSGLLSLRQYLKNQLVGAGLAASTQGVLLALTLGDKSEITSQTRQLLQQTGTAHLLAISGLHVGMLAVLVLFMVRTLLPYFTALKSPLTWQFGSVIIVTLLYALLAGFTLPTQRAWLMIAIFGAGKIFGKPLSALSSWIWAMFLMVLAHPLAPLNGGFWLSFIAVLAILWTVRGYRDSQAGLRHQLKQVVAVQFSVFLVLIPLGLLLFQQSPFISLLVNLFAIPWVGWVLLPLALLGDLCLWLFGWTSILEWAGYASELFLVALQWVNDVQLVKNMLSPEPWVWGLCALLALWWVVPLPWQGRLWVPVLLLSLTVWRPNVPSLPKLTVLDVGQGLAVVLQDGDSHWLYDSGNAYPGGFDLGQAVVAPFLRHNGIEQLDRLVLSHNDEDHIGGAQSVMDNLAVGQLLGSGRDRFSVLPNYQQCSAGQGFALGSGNVSVLWPLNEPSAKTSDNDLSCVLLWQVNGFNILIPGDISQKIEQAILAHYSYLSVDVIVLAHHGSNSSSGWQWLAQLEPQIAIVSAGYLNSYNHPHPKVLSRLQALQIPVWNTAESGSVTVDLLEDKLRLTGYRTIAGKLWFDQPSRSHEQPLLGVME